MACLSLGAQVAGIPPSGTASMTVDTIVDRTAVDWTTPDPEDLGLRVLADLVRASADGILFMATDRRYVYANAAACKHIGYPLEGLVGRDFSMTSPSAVDHLRWRISTGSAYRVAGLPVPTSARARAAASTVTQPRSTPTKRRSQAPDGRPPIRTPATPTASRLSEIATARSDIRA